MTHVELMEAESHAARFIARALGWLAGALFFVAAAIYVYGEWK